MLKILVVEDDRDLRELFCAVLTDNGYLALEAADGVAAFELLEKSGADLVVLDVMLPGMNGYELTRMLRGAGINIPILMITALQSLADKREGFKAGTDDYMVKPVDVDEMIWRIEALLRRSQTANQRKIRLGSTEFDRDTFLVSGPWGSVELKQKEFLLLCKLASSPGRIFTRLQIMDDVWGVDSEADTHTLEVHISRLRERFKNNEDFEIVTVRGLGYKVVAKHE